jgi:glycosyltransferase involved in cell wall biosynthesis
MTFQRRPKICVPIMNCAEDHLSGTLPRPEKELFTIAFTGHIRRHRGLETLTAAISDLKDVELIITGRTEDKALLTQIQEISNVKYLGFLEYGEVLTVEADSDLIVALYDLMSHTQNKYVVGNKLFEAMMSGVPIITNVAQEIVNETECGIIVEYNNIEQIKEAIITLRDNPQLRKRLGHNGRKAFLKKYNWDIMEQRLYKIYDDLLNE